MRIIETFICLLEETNEYVKVHRGRDKSNNSQYFIEYISGSIIPISEEKFESIKDK